MKIFITRRIPKIGIQLLQTKFEVDLYPDDTPLAKDILKQRVNQADALVSLVVDQIDREVIDAAPRLQIISNHAVGVDNIDIQYATERGIAVTNTPGVLTDATADLAWALLMAVSRHIVTGDRMVRSGNFTGWDPLMLLGADMVGKTLGIIGAGRIGTAVAKRSTGWDMHILYFDQSRNDYLERQLNGKKVSLKELLQKSDFVTIHLPLTTDTTHLLGENELNLMKSTAYLINTARGPIVDEQSLVNVLQEGRIAGAALDVFENEPKLTPGLAELNNVLLAPHIGSATINTRNRMAEIAAQNIINIFNKQQPISIVNPEVLKKFGIQN